MTDITELLDTKDVLDLAWLVTTGEVTPRELVEASIARIEARNPTLNAVVADRFEAALAEVDAGLPEGPLKGVPFLVKDLGCDVAGLPATRGSRLFADVVAAEDSELARRYKAAGLVILGNTNSPEFGKNASTEPLLHGPTRNPWRTSHSTGGSSGGTAAAVVGGMVPAAHGNDGGGSIRIPSSACGLFGLKPTRMRTPSWPQPAFFAYPLSIGHALTRTVRDSAAILDATAGGMPGDPYNTPPTPRAGTFMSVLAEPPNALRIGFSTESVAGNAADPAVAEAVERMARICEDLGHQVTEARPAYDPGQVIEAVSTVMGSMSAQQVEARLGELGRSLADDDLEPFTRFMHERSLTTTAIELNHALQSVEFVSRSIGAFFADHDLWLCPTLNPRVPELGWLDTTSPEAMFSRAGKFSEMTAPSNVTGMPAMSVPAGFDDAGLPIGAQFVAKHNREGILLQLASQIEGAAPWPRIAPWPPPA
jgi:amidase